MPKLLFFCLYVVTAIFEFFDTLEKSGFICIRLLSFTLDFLSKKENPDRPEEHEDFRQEESKPDSGP